MRFASRRKNINCIKRRNCVISKPQPIRWSYRAKGSSRSLNGCRKGKLRGGKLKERPLDLSSVIDLHEGPQPGVAVRHDCDSAPAYTFPRHPGLVYFPGALSVLQQLHIIREAWLTYPNSPARTNHWASFGELHCLWNAVQLGLRLQDPVFCRGLGTSDVASPYGGGDAVAGYLPDPTRPQVCHQGDNKGHQPACLDIANRQWGPQGTGPLASQLLRKLRWASIGPPFNWTLRVYESEAPHLPLPEPLKATAMLFGTLAMQVQSGHTNRNSSAISPCTTRDGALSPPYLPSAALVNYYREGDTLGGHRDDVERDLSQPIVSISLGCDAIFLFGGQSKHEQPSAIRLRSGDVLVLSGPARTCFHGVPRILPDHPLPAGLSVDEAPEEYKAIMREMVGCRINISIRAVD